MSPEDELRKANEAKQLLDHPLIKEAMENLEGQLRQLRRNVPPGQSDMHTRIILMEQMADKLFGYLENLALTGRFAAIEIERATAARRMYEMGLKAYQSFGRNAL